jgi:NADH:ubiquinone oxidoreductase subunit E
MIKQEAFVEKSIDKYGRSLIPVLQDIQRQYRYLPEDALIFTAEKLGLSLRDVYGVASFYQAFSFRPEGEYKITVCVGTGCHVRGSAKIIDALLQELKIAPGETTEDAKFTLKAVNCLGCCAIGPIVALNGDYYGEMDIPKTLKLIRSLKNGGRRV